MKTFTLKLSALACVAVLVIAALSMPSCKKDRLCHGKVTVIDTAGAPVAAAAIKLSAPSVGGQVTYTGVSDGAGVSTWPCPPHDRLTSSP